MLNRGKQFLFTLLVVILATTTMSVSADTKNTFSSYTMFGLGRIQTLGTLTTRSMGGAGVGMRTVTNINLLNPASYSTAIPRGVLFDFGLEGAVYNSTQNIDGVDESSLNSTFNFHDIALQMPLAKGLGMAISVSPYSSVGYLQEDDYWLYNDSGESIAKVIKTTEGSGEVAEVKFGVGWEVAKGLSIGASAQYYWGNINRSVNQIIYAITNPTDVSSPLIEDEYSISQIKGQVGLQWNIINQPRRLLVLGATYDFGGDLRPRHIRTVSGTQSSTDVSQIDTTTLEIIKPDQLTVGMSYQIDKIIGVVDYSFQKWGNNNSSTEYSINGIDVKYNNTSTIRAGLEYTPRRGDIRNYAKRVSYRTGFKFGSHHVTYADHSLNEYSVTAGAGFPINMIGISKIDVGFEWGVIGSADVISVSGSEIGLVKEQAFKFSIGVTMFGSDYWFQRAKID